LFCVLGFFVNVNIVWGSQVEINLVKAFENVTAERCGVETFRRAFTEDVRSIALATPPIVNRDLEDFSKTLCSFVHLTPDAKVTDMELFTAGNQIFCSYRWRDGQQVNERVWLKGTVRGDRISVVEWNMDFTSYFSKIRLPARGGEMVNVEVPVTTATTPPLPPPLSHHFVRNLEAVKRRIYERRLALESAYREGNAEKMAALYTEDAVLLPAGTAGSRHEGRAKIAQLWEGALKNSVTGLHFVHKDVVSFGEGYLEEGEYGHSAARGGYMSLWKQDGDTLDWNIWKEFYN